jgi:hypothetical protein
VIILKRKKNILLLPFPILLLQIEGRCASCMILYPKRIPFPAKKDKGKTSKSQSITIILTSKNQPQVGGLKRKNKNKSLPPCWKY